MRLLNDFLSTDYGLLSAGVIAFTVLMAAYFAWFFRKHYKEDLARHQREVAGR